MLYIPDFSKMSVEEMQEYQKSLDRIWYRGVVYPLIGMAIIFIGLVVYILVAG